MQDNKTILVFECESLGQTYELLNQVTAPFEVLEANWMANGRCLTMVLVEANHRGAWSAVAASPSVHDWVEIAPADQALLDAYFSLAQVRVREALLVLEMRSLPRLLHACHSLIGSLEGVELIEIRPYRMVAHPAVAILTGELKPLREAEVWLRAHCTLTMHGLRVLHPLTANFRAHYDLDGE